MGLYRGYIGVLKPDPRLGASGNATFTFLDLPGEFLLGRRCH